MRRRLTLLLAVPFLVLGACGGSDDDTEGDATDAEETTTGGDEDVDLPEGVEVELLDPGQEPRRSLRLAPADDCESRARQRQEQLIEVEIQGQEQSVDQELEIDVVYRCKEVREDTIAMEIEYEGARLVRGAPGTEDVLGEALESMTGAIGKGTYDRRGAVLELTAPVPDLPGAAGEAADDTAESLQDQASQLSSPLPEEPVGVGARWTVTSNGVLSGLPFEQVTTFTITSIDGDVVVADSITEMTIPPGPMDVPGAGSAEIVEGAMTGTGTTTWDLRQVVPLNTSLVEGDIVALLEGPSGDVEMREHIRIEQELVAR
jgi:hypothetical protein